MRRGAIVEIEHYLVDKTPSPALGRVIAFDDRMVGLMKMRGGVTVGEPSQQPTWPQLRHNRRCSHGEPIFKHSSQPSALGVTSRMVSVWAPLVSHQWLPGSAENAARSPASARKVSIAGVKVIFGPRIR